MSNLKTIVRGAYDIQKNRIQTGNRLVGNFKAKLGQAPSEKEDTIDKEVQHAKVNLDECVERVKDAEAGVGSAQANANNKSRGARQDATVRWRATGGPAISTMTQASWRHF